MPRVPRITIENTLYYVTSRGDNNRDIFVDAGDYLTYIDLLKRAKEQFKFQLFAFCLLPTHLHLLIEPKADATISQIMHTLNSNYTKYFNPKHNRSGHLFQERYKVALLEKKPYLLVAGAYTHLNPGAMGLAGNVSEYPYSSYSFFANANTGPIDMKDEAKEVMRLLSGKTYPEFIAGLTKDELVSFGKEIDKKPIIGSVGFTQTVKAAIESKKAPGKDAIGPGKAKRKFVIYGSGIMLLLGVLNLFFYAETLGLKKNVNKEMRQKEYNFKSRLEKEKASEIDDYYRNMSKALEAEKQKARYLEDRIGATAGKK